MPLFDVLTLSFLSEWLLIFDICLQNEPFMCKRAPKPPCEMMVFWVWLASNKALQNVVVV